MIAQVPSGRPISDPAESTTPGSLRDALVAVLALDTGRPEGVLLSIDEIHEATRADVHAIGNAIQHLDRTSQPTGVLLAGLPPDPDVEKEPTFLSRCHAPKMEILSDDEITRGLVETAATEDWTVSTADRGVPERHFGGAVARVILRALWDGRP